MVSSLSKVKNGLCIHIITEWKLKSYHKIRPLLSAKMLCCKKQNNWMISKSVNMILTPYRHKKDLLSEYRLGPSLGALGHKEAYNMYEVFP